MLISPMTVIDEALENLHMLREFLRDEVDERVCRPAQLTSEGRLCKEALQTIRVLIPKLEAVRDTQQSLPGRATPACLHCED